MVLGTLEMTLVLGCFSIAGIFMLLLSLANLDPIHLYFSQFYDLGSLRISVIICLINIYYGQLIVPVTRVLGLILAHTLGCRIILLKYLYHLQPSPVSFQIYRHISIITNIFRTTEQAVSAATLVGLFFVTVSSFGAMFVGWKQMNFEMILVSGIVFVVISLVLGVALFLGCYLHEMSKALLQKWKMGLSTNAFLSKRRSLIRLTIMSMQVVSIPAGYVGVIDAEIKLNFGDKLFDGIISILALIQDII